MSRAYNTSAVAHAIGATPKWLDNILSHHAVPGVETERQGVARQISHQGVLLLLVARTIHVSIGAPRGEAIRLADELVRTGSTPIGLGIQLTLSRAELEEELAGRLLQGVEEAPPRRRGRPPKRRSPATSG